MIRWCSYCQDFIGESKPYENYAITHGICSACAQKGLDISDQDLAKIDKLKAIQDMLRDAGAHQSLKTVDEAISVAIQNNIKPVNTLIGLIAPILWEIGDLWANGKITHQEEEKFTVFFSSFIDRIETYDSFAHQPTLMEKVDILLLNAPNNVHSLGVRVLSLWLHSKGIRSHVLKGAQSLDAIISDINNLKPRFLGFSVALAEQLPAVLSLYQNIQGQLGENSPPLLIGGTFVKQSSSLPALKNVAFISDISQLIEVIHFTILDHARLE